MCWGRTFDKKKIFYPWILDEGNKIQAVLLSYFKAQDKTTVHTGIKNKLAQSVGRRYEHVFLNSIRKPCECESISIEMGGSTQLITSQGWLHTRSRFGLRNITVTREVAWVRERAVILAELKFIKRNHDTQASLQWQEIKAHLGEAHYTVHF